MMLRVETHREQLRLSEEERGDDSLLDLLAAQKSESEVLHAEAKKSLDVPCTLRGARTLCHR